MRQEVRIFGRDLRKTRQTFAATFSQPRHLSEIATQFLIRDPTYARLQFLMKTDKEAASILHDDINWNEYI